MTERVLHEPLVLSGAAGVTAGSPPDMVAAVRDYHQGADCISVQLGIVPAERVGGRPRGNPESRMHDGTRATRSLMKFVWKSVIPHRIASYCASGSGPQGTNCMPRIGRSGTLAGAGHGL